MKNIQPYILLAVFFGASLFLRPLLPVDETRYLTVTWEMLLQKQIFVPTLNFEPYFQKPPLLFWLIELVWAIFGVSRFAAISVMFAISSLVLYFTRLLGKRLFPEEPRIASLLPWLMLGSIPFVIYSSLILFDLLLTLCVLTFALAIMRYADGGRWRYAILSGLCLGLGVLAKGPVVLIHAMPVVFLYPLWRNPASSISARRLALGVLVSLIIGLAVVMAWLLPAFYETGFDFAYNLIWRQSAGRITGSVERAHARPVYFYLLLFPVLLLPWICTPNFWRALKAQRENGTIPLGEKRKLLFLILWCMIVILVFSLIAGKQPHYIVPILPAVILAIGYILKEMHEKSLRIISVAMLALCIVMQAIGSKTYFQRYDLTPISQFIAEHSAQDWAYTGRYQGEFTFLGRLQKPFTQITADGYQDWFKSHPDGYVITKVRQDPPPAAVVIFRQPADRGYYVILKAAP